MYFDGDANTDDFIVTARQIFDYCGVENSGTMHVNAMMDKIVPLIKPYLAEYIHLISLLDPEQNNPEINVTDLAASLSKYSESQKKNTDLNENVSLKSGQVPHDSACGISTDGFQMLEKLQYQFKDKTHHAQQWRTQLDYSEHHHEEALAAVTADTLKSHLNILREKSTALSNIRRNYECDKERLRCALRKSRRELEFTRKKTKILTVQVTVLETEKLILQQQLSISKSKCLRINDMYTSRLSASLKENATLRVEQTVLGAPLQDHDSYMQQGASTSRGEVLKEKALPETKLKDMLDRSNQIQSRADRSIDLSHTEDQMLRALDSLNTESIFVRDQSTIATQANLPCVDCVKRTKLKRYLWDPLKSLFTNICGHLARGSNFPPVFHAGLRPSTLGPLSWRWLQPRNLLNLLKHCVWYVPM